MMASNLIGMLNLMFNHAGLESIGAKGERSDDPFWEVVPHPQIPLG
jgi:hypothetical protein